MILCNLPQNVSYENDDDVLNLSKLLSIIREKVDIEPYDQWVQCTYVQQIVDVFAYSQ